MHFLQKTFVLVAICALSTATLAQDAAWTKVLSKLPQYQRLEGTLTVRGYQSDIGLGGGTAVAHIQFEQPDSLRIELKANPSQGTRALLVVAQGNRTYVYDPVSRRLRELPYNVVRQWWRGSDVLHGGPANALLTGFAPDQLSQFFTVKENTHALQLIASDDKAHQEPDFTRVGGSGDQIFYAPYLQQVWDYAPQVNWSFGTDGLPTEREEGFKEKVLYKTNFTFDPASRQPKTAIVNDFNGRHVATFSYDLKEVSEAFDKSTFTIPAAADQIAEDTQLNAPSNYKAQDVQTIYNKGVALAIGQEDYAGAYSLWSQASKANPKAVAPWFALYESSLLTHDLNRARVALDALAKILGSDNEDVLTRQVSLASSLLQWEDAEAALDQLIKLQPDNAQFLLAAANLQRSQGKTGPERGALGKILAMPEAPSGIQAAAVLNWSLNALTGTDRTAAEIENKTPAQKLAKEIALSNANSANATVDISSIKNNPSLLTALALVQEELGQRQNAINSWKLVNQTFPYPLDRTAQWHVLSLAAQSGDTTAALQQADVLRAMVSTREDTRLFHDQIIHTWQKAFGQETFNELLKRRALAMQSTPQDAYLWLAFQYSFGSDEDVASAIKNGATRFPKDAWWHSLRADSLAAAASSPEAGTPGNMSVAEALNAALQSMDEAIRRDPNQPYYHIQKALILRKIAMPDSVIIDPRKRRLNIEAATKSYQQLTEQWPGNSDVELAANIMHLPLDDSTQHSNTLRSIEETMYRAKPLGASYQNSTALGYNHTRAFTARQAKAAIARRQGNLEAVAQYYQELLVSARNADEEQGIALNYLRQLVYAKDTQSIAVLLTRLAHEPWKWKALSDMMNASGGILAFHPKLANQVVRTLQASSDPYAHWAAARLSATIVASLNLVLNDPQAPDDLQGQQNAAMKSLETALQSLTSVVDEKDKILAARAASALGESALERGTQGADDKAIEAANVAAQWFAKAVAIDPGELAYDYNLITAFHTAGDDASARSARNAMLAKIPLDPEALRNAAKFTLLTEANSADKNLASKLAMAGFLLAQSSSTTSTPTFWRAGLTAARCLMAAGDLDAGQNIYRQLSLPQWTITDQAVVYLDWQYQLKQAGKDQEAIEVQEELHKLGLNNPQMRTVEWTWRMLD